MDKDKINKVTPEYISELINFYSNSIEPNWKYDPIGTDMRNLQTQGAAKAFNLLEEKKLCLLADEVGMGKTMQALAVCATLWNQNPNARILIFAPRDEIAKNWEKEYRTFIRHHYRNSDNLVKSLSGQEPVKKMIFCKNLYSLVHEIQQGWGHLFIGKISSFSSLMAGNKSLERLEKLGIRNLAKARQLSANSGIKLNEEIIKLLKNEINQRKQSSRHPYFDLLIIDEAHYFRKKDGNSLKVNSATEFFGDPNSENYFPLASRVLLLTATPNHSSSKDIGNIVSYFNNGFENKNYKEILDAICIRRLRRLSKNGYNKYNYRDEIPLDSNFKENPLSEMFFGLYQHELAKEINKETTEKQGTSGVSKMMKYLEGVEFIPFEKQTSKDDPQEDEKKSNSNDYTNGSDVHILLEISKRYRDIFEENPKHPKYDKLVEDLTKKHSNDKAIVFVRRIPSVYEIAKRIIEFYDKSFWENLQQSLPINELSYEKLNRSIFRKLVPVKNLNSDEEVDTELEDSKQNETKNIPTSKVMDLFKVIKKAKSTDATYFRLRFNHSKPNVFGMFFSPGADYFNQPYKDFKSYRFEVGEKNLENYYSSALIHRTDRLTDIGTAKDIKSILLSKNPIQNSEEQKDNYEIETLFTIFWDVFLSDSEINESDKNKIKNTYETFNSYEKEAISNFIEGGALLASEALIMFYKMFRDIQEGNNDDKPLIQYNKFTLSVRENLKLLKLYKQIRESILHFRSIYTKVFSINGEKKLLEETWDSFNNAQPIYPYSADNKNQKVLRSFNTPFYPDILVATSVLQEGVNLQYFCDTIYHYGMAWTPGDNEQRIGRIDRMFGKIERMLEENSTSKLNIYYPYLKDTIDEEHLARFAKRKFKEELLIDKGKAFEETEDFALYENDNQNWEKFLRKSDNDSIISDPFPVKLDQFKDIENRINNKSEQQKSLTLFFDSIINAIKELKNFKPEIYFIDQSESYKLLIDPILNEARKQPVVVELLLDSIAAGYYGESVFCLRMRTPLASNYKIKGFIKQFNEDRKIQELYLPGIKLCLDSSQTGSSSWGLYMVIELPLFVKDLSENPLSIEEIQDAFINLIRCADYTEKELLRKDLKKEELNIPIKPRFEVNDFNFRKSKKQRVVDGWKEVGRYYIKEEEIDIESFTDIEKQSLIDNHNHFYVKTLYKEGQWVCQVSYLTKDAYKEELELLEKHLSIAIARLEWEDD